jgi:hypothetical protein
VLRDVKALADALGERRDPDVQLAAMEAFVAAAPPELAPGVGILTGRLRERQDAANTTLAAALEATVAGDLHGRLHALADSAEVGLR